MILTLAQETSQTEQTAAAEGLLWVHYLPIATTALSLIFVAMLVSRASKRNWAPHLVWWAVGVFFYGLGTGFESAITLNGNTVLLNRLWYWAGAVLGGYPLATGSLYLIGKRSMAHVLTAISLAVVVGTSIAVFIAPMDAAAIAAEPHRPSGKHIAESWIWVRYMTPFINLYAAFWLIGGAVWSSVRFVMLGAQTKPACPRCTYDLSNSPEKGVCPECGTSYDLRESATSHRARMFRDRAIGTALIAVGALLPGIGGSMAKADIVEALYIGEFVGLVLICIGYQMCIRDRKKPKAEAG